MHRDNDIFEFNRHEQRGILVLLILLASLFGFSIVFPRFYDPYKDLNMVVRTETTAADSAIAEVPRNTQPSPPFTRKKRSRKKAKVASEPAAKPTRRVVLFQFDPNTIPYDSILHLGIQSNVARNWRKYVEAGGRFRQADDLSKIYGLSADDFARIRSHIHILPDTSIIRSKPLYRPKPILVVGLNEATQEDLEALPGIGPVFAQRIIRFRESLGGFYHDEQLKEVYGLPDSTYQRIIPYCRIEGLIQRMDINRASAEELARHPYIHRKQAELIIRYRHQHGPYAHEQHISRIHAFSPDFVSRILPYLKVDQ